MSSWKTLQEERSQYERLATNVSYFLILIKAYSILVCTHITWFFCSFTSIGDEWEDWGLHSGPNLSKFIPLTHNRCHCPWWVLSTLRVCLVGRIKSGRIENGEMMEKWEDRKDFSFPHLCLVGRVEKWRDGKLFCLVENKVCINFPSWPY